MDTSSCSCSVEKVACRSWAVGDEKKMDKDHVPEKLCESRRQTIHEEIDGLKRTIYVSSLAMTAIIVFVQFILTFK